MNQYRNYEQYQHVVVQRAAISQAKQREIQSQKNKHKKEQLRRRENIQRLDRQRFVKLQEEQSSSQQTGDTRTQTNLFDLLAIAKNTRRPTTATDYDFENTFFHMDIQPTPLDSMVQQVQSTNGDGSVLQEKMSRERLEVLNEHKQAKLKQQQDSARRRGKIALEKVIMDKELESFNKQMEKASREEMTRKVKDIPKRVMSTVADKKQEAKRRLQLEQTFERMFIQVPQSSANAYLANKPQTNMEVDK